MRVLDIATGTGLAAGPALAVVGPTGHVTAADVSPSMVEKARARLGNAPNASVSTTSARKYLRIVFRDRLVLREISRIESCVSKRPAADYAQ